jgi:hypothetical protein
MPIPKISRRRTIVELGYYLTSDGRGAFGHPVQQAVVEGRQYPPSQPGTSCVELPDCIAFAAGCRAEHILRDEHRGFPSTGRPDLGWFYGERKHTVPRLPKLEQLRPGDFIGYDFDRGGHIAVYLGQTPDGRALTADFGQWHGGGRQFECSVDSVGDFLMLRGRRVWASVDADTIVYTASALAVADWCSAHGLPDPGPVDPAEYIAQQWELSQ